MEGIIEDYEMEGDWTDPPAPNVMPVLDEEYIRNVRHSLKLDLPNVKREKDHSKIMVMVCGGPSAKTYLEDIRQKSKDERYHIFCSNKTHDWLLENNIVPHTHFVIDPKKAKVDDVRTPNKDVRYFIGIGCDPEVFKALEGYNVHRLFTVSGVKDSLTKMSDLQLARAFYGGDFAPVEGGSMAGLRAMNIANILGYLSVEFYGFDSCYFETDENREPIYYSYEKKRTENIMEAKTESGKVFLTTPVFASQARQFIKWKHRLAWIKFTIHGDSLTHEINRIDDEKYGLKGILISDYMRTMNKELHAMDSYGNGEDVDVGMSSHVGRMAVLAGEFLKKNETIDILDYGCGKMMFSKIFPPVRGVTIYNYDPCIEGLDKRPEPADIVVCLDVLEHVEFEYLQDVLNDLEKLTKKICYVSIHTKQARKYYSDGQNAHLIVEKSEWWSPFLRKYFDVAEEHITNNHYTVVLQKKCIS